MDGNCNSKVELKWTEIAIFNKKKLNLSRQTINLETAMPRLKFKNLKENFSGPGWKKLHFPECISGASLPVISTSCGLWPIFNSNSSSWTEGKTIMCSDFLQIPKSQRFLIKWSDVLWGTFMLLILCALIVGYYIYIFTINRHTNDSKTLSEQQKLLMKKGNYR